MKNKMKQSKHRRNNKGFSLVELIIAVAILGIVITPIMSAFVVTSRMNLKGRRREQAMTVAQNLVEGVKAFGINQTAAQFDPTNTSFSLIPDNTGSVKIVHSLKSSVLKTSVINITGYELMDKSTITGTDGGAVYVSVSSTEYNYSVENILMGSIYFDADIKITPNFDKDYVVSYYYSKTFTDAGMSNLKYYNVQVDVSLHGETDVLATYYGTFLDQR